MCSSGNWMLQRVLKQLTDWKTDKVTDWATDSATGDSWNPGLSGLHSIHTLPDLYNNSMSCRLQKGMGMRIGMWEGDIKRDREWDRERTVGGDDNRKELVVLLCVMCQSRVFGK